MNLLKNRTVKKDHPEEIKAFYVLFNNQVSFDR